MATAQAGVLIEPAAKASVEQLGDTTIRYKLTYWIADPLSNQEISSALKLALWHNFKPIDISLN